MSVSTAPVAPAASTDWQHGGFGIYVHWPFCAAKCPYCDFNSHVRNQIDTALWTSALVTEIERAAAEVPGRRVESVFFGGGTPSLMPPDTVGAVISAIDRGWGIAEDVEITLEANPTSVEAERFRGFRDAGVNRLSMGIQSLHDVDLRALGRRHTAAEALKAFDIARTSFTRVSFDLIYARQRQTVADWESELRMALDLAVDHLSLYQLTIEPGTRFGELAARGNLRDLPTDGNAAEMYAITQDICRDAGMPAYEVSNHARKGAESRHNLVYWRYGDYLGIGPGAHGRVTLGPTRWATEAVRLPEAYLDAINTSGTGIILREPVEPADQAVEMLMMGLRLAEGVDAGRYAALAGKPLPADRLGELCDLGLLRPIDGRVIATPDGRRLLNAVLRRLLA